MLALIAGITAAGAAAAKGIAGAVQGAKQNRLAEEQAEAVAQQQANYGKYYDQRFRGLQDEAMGNQMAMAQSGGSAGAQGSNMRNAISQSPVLTAAASRAADAYALGRSGQENQTLGQQQALERAGMQAKQQANMGLIDLFGQGATGVLNAASVMDQQNTANKRYDEWNNRQNALNQASIERQDAMANLYAQRAANNVRPAAPAPLTEAQESEIGYQSQIAPYGNQYQDLVTQVGNDNPASNMTSSFGDPLGVNNTNRIRR